MTLRASVLLALASLLGALAIAEGPDDAFESNYRDLAALPYPMLIAELDEQIEWLLVVSTAAPPDLRHKIDAIKISIFEKLKTELCAASDSGVSSRPDKRGAATRSLVAALSPKSVSATERGAIAATLVRIVELEPDRFCLRD